MLQFHEINSFGYYNSAYFKRMTAIIMIPSLILATSEACNCMRDLSISTEPLNTSIPPQTTVAQHKITESHQEMEDISCLAASCRVTLFPLTWYPNYYIRCDVKVLIKMNITMSIYPATPNLFRAEICLHECMQLATCGKSTSPLKWVFQKVTI
jgi:hypothetical protein